MCAQRTFQSNMDAQLTTKVDELLLQGDGALELVPLDAQLTRAQLTMKELVPVIELDVEVEWETDSDAIDDERLDDIQDVLAEVHRIIDGSRSSYISGGTTPKKCYMGCVFSTAVTVTTIRELMLDKLKTITYEATVKVMDAGGRKLDIFPVV